MDLDGAIAVLLAGDVDALADRLRADPGLVHARVMSTEGHYCGYFHQATLLHHVAGNPTIAPMPATAVELAGVLLDAGAAVDALTVPGPAQPSDIGWTTLGLVATSLDARQAGLQRRLLELLISRGADVDARDGGALIGALYYGEHEAAALLVERGARVDLIAAAGLGRIDLMARFLDDDGTPAPDARRLIPYGQQPQPPRDAAELRTLALAFASKAGRAEAVAWLLARGADPTARALLEYGATALHWAAHEGHAEVVELLLAHGADRTIRDLEFDGDAAGWAHHGGHPALAARLARLDR